MMELRLVQATLFKNVLEALSDLFSKANFDFSGTGFELQAMDTSGVALFALLLRTKAFNHYCCDRDLSVGLNLADMAKALRCANNDDIITIEFEEECSNTVAFKFDSPEDGESSYFVFDFVGINGLPFEIPESLEHQAIVRMPSAKFMRICNKLSSFGDSGDRDTTVVIISVDKELVYFSTRGKTGTLTIFCSQTQSVDKAKEPMLIEMKEKVSLTFDLRYMNSFSKVPALSDQVTISLSSELPAVFEYKIAEMGYFRCYMVPRIEKYKMQNEGDEVQN